MDAITSPLIYASYNGHLDVVKEFLAHSASVDASDNNGWTPLNRAAYSGHLDVVKELLAHNATIDAADNYGWTPLDSASYSGHLGVVKELLAHELDIVKELLERGASYDLTNKNGETARDVGDESIQDIFDTFLMSVSPSSIRFAIELIQKALVDTSDSNSEIILAASEVLSTTLNAQTQRMTVLTIGLMVERILRYFIRHESSDKAHAVLEVLKKIQNYFDTELLMVQPWNLIRLQDHLLEATENSQINLKVQVVGNMNDLAYDIGNMMETMNGLENYLESITTNVELQEMDKLAELAVQIRRGLEHYERQVVLGNIPRFEDFEEMVGKCQNQIFHTVSQICVDNTLPISFGLGLIESWMLSSDDVKFDPHDEATFLGKGGFGSVFKGIYHGQVVAVKRFDGIEETDSADLEKRIAKEIKGWKDVSHEPYILTLIGVCTKIPTPILVSELCETNIRRYVRDWPEKIVPMVYQFACGLVSLHKSNIIHRDIKGDNVLVTFQKKVAIADFGLSQSVASFENMKTGAKGAGTMNWMSPEQYFSPRYVTPKSDIWSFGMTLWEILCDEVPFRVCSEHEFEEEIFKSEDDRPEKPEDMDSELKPLWTLVTKCWQLDPTTRPSAIDIVDFLKSHYSSQLGGL
ncbi:hypothetical protein LEN26_001805 [Aphanomyces euteiches]|nr:hypothetical protein LEN26_001805 [Aphanomyces euteiches]